MIDYYALKALNFEPVVQSYTEHDTRLYALGLNLGSNPTDEDDLAFVAADPPLPVVTMPMTLARLGPWMRDPSVGIDYRKIVVGEASLRLHASLPPAATVIGTHKVVRVTDKGAGRGALVTVERRLYDRATGTHLATFEQVTFCRGDGGFSVGSSHDEPLPVPEWDVSGPPDLELSLVTAPNQALIYRLSGDMNPLHACPEAARAAGFEKPILHGLATLGMAGHRIDRAFISNGLGGLSALQGRLAAPVFPGERLRLEAWNRGSAYLFVVRNSSGREVVSLGRAEMSKPESGEAMKSERSTLPSHA
jgi:acyl dehydratase